MRMLTVIIIVSIVVIMVAVHDEPKMQVCLGAGISHIGQKVLLLERVICKVSCNNKLGKWK